MRPHDLAKSIFLQAIELPAPERAAFVAGECAGSPELQADVETLLALHSRSLVERLATGVPGMPPESIAGYRVLGELGGGGMGVVYLARKGDGPEVALRLLRRDQLGPTRLARFPREAHALSGLDHPGIARLLDSGVESGPDGPRPWLATERIEGVDLRAWGAAPHSAAEKLELLARVCDAVEHAHRQGVMHRDLEPANVRVRPDGRPAVLDFGVAGLTDSDVRATTVVTHAGLVAGTVRYLSPEQAEARPDGIGPRSDVYALGVLAYELLTGRMPYEVPERSLHRALVAVMSAPPQPAVELPAPLRRGLEPVLGAALAKDPAQRTASAGALAVDLRRVAAGRRPAARPVREGRAPGSPVTRPALALASLAVLFGILLSAWRTPPTPADWLEGLAQPHRVYRRVMTAIDSAAVRLHGTTRTPEREREAREWLVRARALLRVIGWRPYAARVERLALFRAGEAEYLLGGRIDDVARYEAAARLWTMARDPRVPRADVPLPDTLGPSALALTEPGPMDASTAASMAYADAARLAHPAQNFRRALEMLRERERRGPVATSGAPGDRIALGFEGRLGAALVGCGFHEASPETLREGLRHLRAALVLVPPDADPPSAASELHEMGAGEARLARLTRDPALLDSAFAHLRQACAIRTRLDESVGRCRSRLELASAERLAARLRPAGARAAIARAESLLALRREDVARLGPSDAAAYALASVATAIDGCCVRRDTTALAATDATLARLERRIDRRRVPLLAVEAALQRARIGALQGAVGHDLRALRGAHRALWEAGRALDGRDSRPLVERLDSGLGGTNRPGAPYVLDAPVPEPY